MREIKSTCGFHLRRINLLFFTCRIRASTLLYSIAAFFKHGNFLSLSRTEKVTEQKSIALISSYNCYEDLSIDFGRTILLQNRDLACKIVLRSLFELAIIFGKMKICITIFICHQYHRSCHQCTNTMIIHTDYHDY